MKKRKLIRIMYVVTPVMLVLLLALNVFTILKVKALEDVAGTDDPEDVAQENDVTIDSDYVIRATTQISDAYKSGDASKLSDADKETLDMAKSVLDEIITDGMSDYEKELAVYEWMTANIGFDDGSLTVIPDENDLVVDNPHGVLQTHKAVCVGYATTFRLFMQMMDIECMVVHDSYLSHSWDLVKLDGEWYHTDIYFDAGSGDFSHFNLNDTAMMDMQEWNTDFFPAADGYKYNYAYINKVECRDVYSIPEQVRAAIDSESGVASFDLGKDISDDTYSILETIMNQIQNAAVINSDKCVGMSWSWLEAEDENIFCVYLSYANDDIVDPDDNVDIDAETQQKIDEAVNKAFGDISDGSDTANAVIGCDGKTVINR